MLSLGAGVGRADSDYSGDNYDVDDNDWRHDDEVLTTERC